MRTETLAIVNLRLAPGGHMENARDDLGPPSHHENGLGYRLNLLGGLALSAGHRSVGVPGGCRTVLAVLALCGPATRLELIERLWPGVDGSLGSGRLRTALWRLHRAAPGVVEVDGELLRLSRRVDVDVDSWCRWARRVVAGAIVEQPSPVVEDLLPGCYDDWVLLERERVRHLLVRALETRAVQLYRCGRHLAAVETALSVIALEPLRESAHATLVQVYLIERDLAQARRHATDFREMLRVELAVDASPAFLELASQTYTDGHSESCPALLTTSSVADEDCAERSENKR